MLKNTSFRSISLLGLLLVSSIGSAATTLVAVAANFAKPMTEIAAEFEKATGHTAKLSFGSSGKFVSQMQNGAPFEVFLSADESGPLKLEQSGFAVSGSRFIYALGKLVLWSATPGLVDDQGKVLSSGSFKHLALADPKLAPYGVAAMEILKNQGLSEKLQPLIVLGENIAQTQQFVSTGNAELGFIALSQVIENGKIASGSGWIVPTDCYAPIKQSAVLLTLGTENPAAKALIDYLKSAPALAIIEKYGYDLAKEPEFTCMLTNADLDTLLLTCKIAGIATALMLLIGTPLAWWLTRTSSSLKGIINTLVALPLVLPPSVLGFYLLVLMGPAGPVGKLTVWLGLGTLPFTFSGLVVASVLYSIPFVVQPLQASFAGISEQALEAAATLRASPLDTFFSVVMPLAKPGFLSAAILGFAHTVGEFGVVLMVGGNIPDKTRVVSVQIYNHVEALEYSEAHWLAGCLLLFSFSVLLVLYTVLKTQPVAHPLK